MLGCWIDANDHMYIENLAVDEKQCPPFVNLLGGCTPFCHPPFFLLVHVIEPSDIILTCTGVCMDLDGSTCSESLPERTCHFEPPEHVPRTSARAQTCVWGPGGLPVCHGAECTRKDPRPEEKKKNEG